MNDFAQFIGFFTAHLVWQLEGGENVVPMIAIQKDNTRSLMRVPDDNSYERAVIKARELLQAVLLENDYALLALDGYLNLPNIKYEALFIEAIETQNSMETAFYMAIPYRNASAENGLSIFRPIVMKNIFPDVKFLEKLYEGASTHTKGWEFWENYADDS